jgi:hypothetical protein
VGDRGKSAPCFICRDAIKLAGASGFALLGTSRLPEKVPCRA